MKTGITALGMLALSLPTLAQNMKIHTTDGATMAIDIATIDSITFEFVPTAGLVAHYRLDGDAKDASENALNGTVVGASAAADRFGRSDGSLEFNGTSSYVVVPDTGKLNVDTLSVSAWIYRTGTGSGTYPGIVSKYNAEGGYLLAENNSTTSQDPTDVNTVGFWTRSGQGGSYKLVCSTAKVATLQSKWTHVVGVFTGTKMMLYMDGILDKSVDGGAVVNVSEDLYIGRYTDGQNFKGRIDDVRIYSRALMDSEVLALYHEGGWTGQ